jgi:hypothetical protein
MWLWTRVRSIDDAVEHWQRTFGYPPMTEPVTNTRQKVGVVFLREKRSIDIKLIEPCNETSPISAFVKRGGGLHHRFMRCGSLDRELARLTALGLRTLSPPGPGEASANERIAFVSADHGLNNELIEINERAKRHL